MNIFGRIFWIAMVWFGLLLAHCIDATLKIGFEETNDDTRPIVVILTPVIHNSHVHFLLPAMICARRRWNLRWILIYNSDAAIPCSFEQADSFIHQWTQTGSALDKINFALKGLQIAKRGYVMFLHDTEMLLPTLPFVDLTEDIYFFPKEDPLNGERTKTFIARASLIHPVRANLDYNPSPLDIDRLFMSALRKQSSAAEQEIKIFELPTAHIYFGMLMHFCGHRKVKPVCYSVAPPSDPGSGSPRPSVQILTPCHRPRFLVLLLPFVEDASMFWSVKWTIVYDKRRVSSGLDFSQIKPTIQIEQLYASIPSKIKDDEERTHEMLNYALDRIEDSSVYLHVLPDDTVLHPMLPRTPFTDKTVVGFGQYYGKVTNCERRKAQVKAQHAQRLVRMPVLKAEYLGQFLATRKAIGKLRFGTDMVSGGSFIRELVSSASRDDAEKGERKPSDELSYVIPKPLSYYAALGDWCSVRTCNEKHCISYTGECGEGLVHDITHRCAEPPCHKRQCCVAPREERPLPLPSIGGSSETPSSSSSSRGVTKEVSIKPKSRDPKEEDVEEVNEENDTEAKTTTAPPKPEREERPPIVTEPPPTPYLPPAVPYDASRPCKKILISGAPGTIRNPVNGLYARAGALGDKFYYMRQETPHVQKLHYLYWSHGYWTISSALMHYAYLARIKDANGTHPLASRFPVEILRKQNDRFLPEVSVTLRCVDGLSSEDLSMAAAAGSVIEKRNNEVDEAPPRRSSLGRATKTEEDGAKKVTCAGFVCPIGRSLKSFRRFLTCDSTPCTSIECCSAVEKKPANLDSASQRMCTIIEVSGREGVNRAINGQYANFDVHEGKPYFQHIDTQTEKRFVLFWDPKDGESGRWVIARAISASGSYAIIPDTKGESPAQPHLANTQVHVWDGKGFVADPAVSVKCLAYRGIVKGSGSPDVTKVVEPEPAAENVIAKAPIASCAYFQCPTGQTQKNDASSIVCPKGACEAELCCKLNRCRLPHVSELPGIAIDQCSTVNSPIRVNQCVLKCLAGFQGDATATCDSNGGTFVVNNNCLAAAEPIQSAAVSDTAEAPSVEEAATLDEASDQSITDISKKCSAIAISGRVGRNKIINAVFKNNGTSSDARSEKRPHFVAQVDGVSVYLYWAKMGFWFISKSAMFSSILARVKDPKGEMEGPHLALAISENNVQIWEGGKFVADPAVKVECRKG